MTSATCTIRKHAGTGLLYTIADGKATIVGCTQMDKMSLTIPPVVIDEGLPYPVTAVGESAFAYHPCLQTVELPEQLTAIGHGAFEGVPLSQVTLPAGVTTVAPYAFYGCAHLAQVDLAPYAELAEHSFGGCSALEPGHVQNLAFYTDEACRRAGLPMASAAAPTIVYMNGQPVGNEPKADPILQLLNDGIVLENERKYSAAAAAYMQAHEYRRSIASQGSKVQQEARMEPIARAELRLAKLLKYSLCPACNPDGTPRPTAQELLSNLVETTDLADAAYELGDMLAYSCYGVPADPARALELLKSAANRGHERACLDLGDIYLLGTLAPVSSSTARYYYKQCAALNAAHASIARERMAGLFSPFDV